ncbi:glycosyltransferase family 92 protein [Dyadobacter sediminis]|uniref:Glycosyltransferase family 2 protein n=1 Tax=Dyadobacter sediminis TaxID=1493691 RepID=A0A5R9KJ25_9BACT|nr:glycosyltransferase family 92 protein [Dyadobacter sediminis]TLU96218.1 glycosyltransferase family 2 protein [Dyadobacter sediminis]GGB80300.1 hypothetical protein GCM10011325_04800 [Dyadobacter sediminis]
MFADICNFWNKVQHKLRSKPSYNHYLSICCIVKDENEYLEEWINYHRKIGVQHFYIYDNESKKPVRQTLQRIGSMKYVTVNRIYGKVRQLQAYNDCLKNYGNYSQWIGFIDIDEFIVPKSTDGNLTKLLQDYEGYGGLGINWLIFGSNGHVKRTNRPIMESYFMRAKIDFHVHRHIKCIVQPRYVRQAAGPHAFFFQDGYYCVNENYTIINSSFSDVSVGKIHINHYYCKSLEEYYNKLARGLADTSRRTRSLKEFYNHDAEANVEQDETILIIFDTKTIK